MKILVLSACMLGFATFANAQVILRNDFVIGPHHKVKNKGLSFITFNLDRSPNLNMLVNGRGGRSITLDVAAIRQPGKEYTYSELAEKIYTPGAVYKPSVEAVPFFLLVEPPSLHMPVFRMARLRNY